MLRFLALLFILVSLPLISRSEEVTADFLDNHFDVNFPNGDRATVYLVDDHSIILMPSPVNREFSHISWGHWQFSHRNQALRISGMRRCKVLSGYYHVTRKRNDLLLQDRTKSFVFRTSNGR